MKNFVFGKDIIQEDLGGGVKRKIMAYSDNLMTVELHFDVGAVGAMHSHPHEQISYIKSGKFEFTIGEETKIVSEGDTLYKQPDIPHGAVCLEEGVLIDIFTPKRDDFLE